MLPGVPPATKKKKVFEGLRWGSISVVKKTTLIAGEDLGGTNAGGAWILPHFTHHLLVSCAKWKSPLGKISPNAFPLPAFWS